MSSDPKRDGKGKKSSTRKRAVKKDSSKPKKRTRKKKTQLDAQAISEAIDRGVTESAYAGIELVSKQELQRMTRDNSFIVNPLVASAWFQKDLEFAARRAQSAEELHNYLFNPLNMTHFDDKTLVTLYGIAVNDVNKRTALNIKLAETSEKARLVRETIKAYIDKEKQQELENQATESSHVSQIVQELLEESMRKSLDDEIRKKWGDSNSYRPPENTNYEILAVDPEAED